MKTKKAIYALIAFVAAYFMYSCNKLDVATTEQTTTNIAAIEAKFFTIPAGTSDLTKRVIEEIKKRNEKSGFVAEFAENNGFPVWDKALFEQRQNENPSSVSANSINNNSGPTDTLILIPLVNVEQQKVTGLLRVVINNGIGLNYSLSEYYKNYASGLNNLNSPASQFALLNMYLNKHVYGVKNYTLTDHKLFSSDTTHTRSHALEFDDLPPGATNNLFSSTICINSNITITYCNSEFCFINGNCMCIGTSCPDNDCGVYTLTISNCTTTQGPEWPTPGNGGSGGGGGGSGSIPPYYPCTNGPSNPPVVVPLTTNSNNVYQGPALPPCPPPGPGTGWNPAPPTIPNPPPPSDSIPNQLSRRVSRELDSLYLWGMNNGYREQSFIIVKNTATGAIYPKNFTPGFPNGFQTRVNYTLTNTEQLLAYVHTHAEDTADYYRTAFSPDDLIEFNKNANVVGYTALLEVGNARYAFVLEDVQKKIAFNVSKRGRHVQLFNELLETLTSISNGQIKTEQAWIQYLGSASITGIGFYKSSISSNKNVFTKLNP
jgi:hypothetical protein